MYDSLRNAVGALKAQVARIDPTRMRAVDAVTLLDLVEAERVCAAAGTLLAARASDASTWKREGHRPPAHGSRRRRASASATRSHPSKQDGASRRSPRRERPRTGVLSERQTREIASTAAGAPEEEEALFRQHENGAWLASEKSAAASRLRKRMRPVAPSDCGARDISGIGPKPTGPCAWTDD